MNPEYKEQWLKDLRSGDFTQTQGALHRTATGPYTDDSSAPAGYCCLGVLYKQLEEKGLVCEAPTGMNSSVMIFKETNPDLDLTDSIESSGGFTLGVAQLVGITRGQESELIHKNDDEGNSFEEIADWIEGNL